MTSKTSNKMSSTKPWESKEKLKAPSRLFNNITEASKNARKIYFLYVGFLIYCALTVVSISDRQIILNETVSLPIINMDVSLDGFFILCPVIAIFIFIYLQLYLNIRKDLINSIRTYYPQIGREHLYPWILVSLDFQKKGLIGRFQSVVVKFSVWCPVPIVLLIICTWFVKKHDPILAYIIGVTPILGAIIVLWFWFRYENIKFKIWQILKLIPNNLGKSVLMFIVVIYEIVFLFFIIPSANAGFPQIGQIKSNKNKILYPLKSFFCIDLSYQKLTTEGETDYKGIYSVDLYKVHLEGATLISTILKGADLRGAHLRRARMDGAIIQEADLEDADLRRAILKETNLQGANLWHSNLQEAFLEDAKLQKAKLMRADLRNAKLPYANLQESVLGMAKLQGAELFFANLRGADLWLADLRGANLFRANLQGAILKKANLQNAKLREVDFQRADFVEAELQEADLRRANLQNVLNLTVEQVCEVKTLFAAKLDPNLRKQIEEKCPYLLEKPKEGN